VSLVVLYGYKTWSFILREGYRLLFFENKKLMRIFGSKSEEVTAEWRKLRDESFIICTVYVI
jgi:hypothetical protein